MFICSMDCWDDSMPANIIWRIRATATAHSALCGDELMHLDFWQRCQFFWVWGLRDSSVGAAWWMALQWGQETQGLLEGLRASRALGCDNQRFREVRVTWNGSSMTFSLPFCLLWKTAWEAVAEEGFWLQKNSTPYCLMNNTWKPAHISGTKKINWGFKLFLTSPYREKKLLQLAPSFKLCNLGLTLMGGGAF